MCDTANLWQALVLHSRRLDFTTQQFTLPTTRHVDAEKFQFVSLTSTNRCSPSVSETLLAITSEANAVLFCVKGEKKGDERAGGCWSRPAAVSFHSTGYDVIVSRAVNTVWRCGRRPPPLPHTLISGTRSSSSRMTTLRPWWGSTRQRLKML